MKSDLSKLLDECIARLDKGEIIEDCLAEYPNAKEQLEPLLQIAASISAVPKVYPSDDFRRASKDHLMTRLRQESTIPKAVGKPRIML